jgi:hypothetical protein
MAKQAKTQPKKKLSAGGILNELKTPALLIVGMVGGTMAGKMLDKVMPVDETATGFQVKSLVKPVVQIGVGMAGALLLKDQNLKLVAAGVTASGIASTVKVFLKKDILAGLGDPSMGAPIKRVFREPINLSIEPYNPDLPELPAHAETVPVEGMPNMGELDDYQEVQEVQIL